MRTRWMLFGYLLAALLAACSTAAAADPAPPTWISAKAYAIPKETAPEGEGYFSIVCGHNGRLYIGTHANAVNSWLVEFSPKAEQMKIVVDTHKEIGTDATGFAAQAKIHTRNNVGASGKIYFGTKQGYPGKEEVREDYPGGYPMVYDPKTQTTKVYPIPVPHHGINSIAPDESRGLAYISTCSDHRPGPGENAVFLVLDLKTGKYTELIDTEHFYGFINVDYRGRAYHPILGGDIARYNPETKTLDRLKQLIDGKPPTEESRLALTPRPDPINWDISPDRKTLYSNPMRGNSLFAYDLSGDGDTLRGRYLGELIPGAEQTDCRALCVGASGTVWAAIVQRQGRINMLHLCSYTPGDDKPVDHGQVEISNPDFTPLTDADGKTLPFHAGIVEYEGHTVTKTVILGVCEGADDAVYVLALTPYTLLRIPTAQLKR